MELKEQVEIVRCFFEDDDYRSVAAELCMPDMKPAIEAYLLDLFYKQRDFASLDLSRLVACFKIEESETLKELLFRALDLWAENCFSSSTQISATMEAYVIRASQTLEDCLSPGKYVNPAGLRHVELLKQYLNMTFKDERKAALWEACFQDYFDEAELYPAFARVFLLMMLDESKHRALGSNTELDIEPLAMLVFCGYNYMAFSGDDPDEATINGDFTAANDIETIFSSVIELAVKHRFYTRKSHEKRFSFALSGYIKSCVHSRLLSLLSSGDTELRLIFCEAMLKSLAIRDPYYQRKHRAGLAALAAAVPEHIMRDCQAEWNRVLSEASKKQDFAY